MTNSFQFIVIFILALLLGGTLPAQFGPQGVEFQVNAYSPGSQYTSEKRCVAMDDAGNFVVVWNSYGQDGDKSGIFAQRFDSAGMPRGSEIQVNAYTTGSQKYPCVAMDSNGDFVVAWHGDGQGSSGNDVYARRFNSTGTPAGSDFLVSQFTYFNNGNASAAMDDAGNFVIVWESWSSQDGSGAGVFGRRYTSSGVAAGNEFQVNTYTVDDQYEPSVAMDADGDFVVCWTSRERNVPGVVEIFAQRFDNTGTPVGAEFQVNASAGGDQVRPDVEISSTGDFVVSWADRAYSQDAVVARTFDSSGTPTSSDLILGNYGPSLIGHDFESSVAVDDGGNFVVCWQESAAESQPGIGIFGQRVDNTGALIGAIFLINTYVTNDQHLPSVAMAPFGDFVVAWTSVGQDNGTTGVYAQRYGEPKPEIMLTTASFTFVEDDSATLLDAGATFTTPAPDLASGFLSIEYLTAPLAEDELLITQSTTVRRNGSDIEYDASGVFGGGETTVGNLPASGPGSGLAGTGLKVTFNASCTPAIAEEVLRACAYMNASQQPDSTQRTLRIAVDDGSSQLSNQPSLNINVVPVNDAPGFVASNPPAVYEDAGAQIESNWAVFSPGPAAEAGQSVLNYIVSNLSNAPLFAAPPAVDTSGELTYTGAPDAFGTCTFDVVVVDDGGVADGGVDTSPPQAFTITINPVNDAPGFSASSPPAVDEDAGHQVVINWASFDAGPGEGAGQSVLNYVVSNLSNAPLFAAPPAVDTSGELSYTGAPDAFGTCTFDVVVVDDGGVADGGVDTSPPQAFTITINPVNDAPTLTAVTPFSGAVENTSFAITFAQLAGAADEADVDSPVIEFRVEHVTAGALTLNGGPVSAGATVVGAGNVLEWTPPSGQTGLVAGFGIAAYDGMLASSPPVDVSIDVAPLPEFGSGDDGDGTCSAADGSTTGWSIALLLSLILVAVRVQPRRHRRYG